MNPMSHIPTHKKICRPLLAMLFTGLGLAPAVYPAPAVAPALKSTAETWTLIDSDEFAGIALDWSAWQHEPGTGKKGVYRGPEQVKVKDGMLHLMVNRKAKEGFEWSAASIYRVKPIPNGAYVEARFKMTACSGVNNAFWLSCRPMFANNVSNRYEIDIVENRFDPGKNQGRGHLAWHDWKGYGYIRSASGAPDHIAQGIEHENDWDTWQTWGFFIEDGRMTWYLNGEAIWDGNTHEKYTDQHRTGVGKFATWSTNEEGKAYGRYGQSGWDYQKGYRGDLLNVMFSTMPWADKWTPLTDAADGTAMVVDYVRVFMPQRLANREAKVMAKAVDGKVSLPSGKLAAGNRWYATLDWKPRGGDDVSFEATVPGSATRLLFGKRGKDLFLSDGTREITTASVPATAWNGKPVAADGSRFIVRVAPDASREDHHLVSIMLVTAATPAPEWEPYADPNVGDRGETSANHRWHLTLPMARAPIPATFQTKTGGEFTSVRIAGEYRGAVGP